MKHWPDLVWNSVVAVALFQPAIAGTIRHDRADSLHLALAAEPQFAPVGRVTGTEGSGAFLASGTLISDRWMLTAAHVVDGSDGLGGGLDNLEFHLGGQTFKAEAWFVHPGWVASGGESNLFAGWDLAAVRLKTPVTHIVPASLNTNSDELGRVATLVGFGATGTGLTGAQPGTAGTKRAGRNRVDISGDETTAGSVVSIGNDRMLAIDFDRPGVPGESTLGSPLPLDLEYLTAPGDSGGGLFIEVDGEFLLAGVTSLGSTLDNDANSDYGDRAAFTRVSQFNDWINDTLQAHSPTIIPSLAGDYNLDGVVNAADYTVWRDSLGAAGASLPADGDGDRLVGVGDFELWRDNFGARSAIGTGSLAAAAHQVSEPFTLAMMLLLACAYGFSPRFKTLTREGERGCTDDGQEIETLTEAEFMLLLGKESQTRVRQGESLDSIANRHRLSPVRILAAMEFAASSNAVILRRLIDDADW